MCITILQLIEYCIIHQIFTIEIIKHLNKNKTINEITSAKHSITTTQYIINTCQYLIDAYNSQWGNMEKYWSRQVGSQDYANNCIIKQKQNKIAIN